MLIEFETESGAVYVVDFDGKKICRMGKPYREGARAREECAPKEAS